jgi:preprotein translocase subunit SecA
MSATTQQPESALAESFLERLGDALMAFSDATARFLTRLMGTSSYRTIKNLGYVPVKDGDPPYRVVPGSLLARINELEPRMRELSDEQLKALTPEFRRRLSQGATLDDLLPEAFAACRESARRYKNMRHFDVQILGGIVLHRGCIAEMVTGEGKTLVATLAAYLNALEGKGVHIVTVNDYLARRDCEWMTPIYQGLGVTAGFIQSDMSTADRRRAYDCDITYGTNSEFGFDYLRDNMKPARWGDPVYPVELQQCQRTLHYAIIDEVDNILIDEARTPLIISGSAFGDVSRYAKANAIAKQLKPGIHFEIKEKEHTCHLTEEGIHEAERLAGVESFYTAGNMEWPHLIDQALKAHHLYKRDKHYVVMPHPETGEMSVIIVDEFTGRLMIGRQWSDGLHQAVEAKEGVKIKEETQTLATITLQNFFKLYRKLAGMTGTAMTEANEFWKIYKLEVIAIPTNKPLRRINYPDVVFRYEREKWKAIVDEIVAVHQTGRPILVGTVDVAKSEKLAAMLKARGIKCELLNAKPEFAAREAEIIAQAGRLGAVTISTNMAGRGTDIILGGNPEFLAWAKLRHQYPTRLDVPPDVWKRTVEEIEAKEKMQEEGRKVAALGGLHVIGTERHEARRIDNQLRGRAGRQGDPGSSKFFLSLEDDLMRIFAGEWVTKMLNWMGVQEGEPISGEGIPGSAMVSRRIEAAQKKVEERNFDIRKNLLEYDEVMDHQRRKVYGFRQEILEGANCKLRIWAMLEDQVRLAVNRFLDDDYGADCFAEFVSHRLGVEFDGSSFSRSSFEDAVRYCKDRASQQAGNQLQEALEENLSKDVEPREWNWQAFAHLLKTRWGLQLSERDLKKIGRDQLYEQLLPRIQEKIEAVDLSQGADMLRPDYGRRALCDWLRLKFQITLPPDLFADKEPDEVRRIIGSELDRLYVEKEIEFPVQAGLARFLSDRNVLGSARYDREGLYAWARQRFPEAADLLQENDFRTQSRSRLKEILLEASRRCYPADGCKRLDAQLRQTLGEDKVLSDEQAAELAAWANSTFRLDLRPDSLTGLTFDQARQELWDAFDLRYRPEMRAMERSLLLSMLDSSWKDHLYVMDHLRSGIGLVGYAQIDPKTEYKRQGMKAFEAMWEGVQAKVTDLVFRMEETAEHFASTLWQITAARKEEAASALAAPPPADGTAPTAARKEPIRHRGARVGRNDPCPCGSGKKYKNCCMQTAV